MVATARVDPYETLIRKIGYSVGLEDLVERVKKLVSIYTSDGAISASAFRDLVENGFGRKNAVEHFANFYSTLNLVRGTVWETSAGPPSAAKRRILVPKVLEPLYLLDSLSVLRRIFSSDDAKYDIALKVVLTQAILEADGDVFLNALLSEFETGEMKVRFEAMIRKKRLLLRQVMRSPGVIAKIDRIVDIKNESGREQQEPTEESPVGRFARRTESLGRSRRTLQLTRAADAPIDVPADYLKKVSVSRQGWAKDLGLFAKEGMTERGLRLVQELRQVGEGRSVITTIENRQTALFWGFSSELLRIRIDSREIDATDWELWDLLNAIASAFLVTETSSDVGSPKADEVFKLLRRAFDLYKAGSSTKQLIRNNLPLYIAEPVLAGWCVAKGRALPDIVNILETEFGKRVRRVEKMIIRGTAGALFFSKDRK